MDGKPVGPPIAAMRRQRSRSITRVAGEGRIGRVQNRTLPRECLPSQCRHEVEHSGRRADSCTDCATWGGVAPAVGFEPTTKRPA
jgi:hypothetical protein